MTASPSRQGRILATAMMVVMLILVVLMTDRCARGISSLFRIMDVAGDGGGPAADDAGSPAARG